MTCYHPIDGYRAKRMNENGKFPVVFNIRDGHHDLPITVPCGRCIGCRIQKSRVWATRLVHEASLHDDNCYLTLTYHDKDLPKDGSVKVEHFQKFMKRLRKKIKKPVRFFHCGEYGDENKRPHYHAILFNHDFADKKFLKNNKGNKLYISKTLDKIWKHGDCYIGDVTFESCAYVARYILKKINGKMAESHYKGRKPEYITMSRRPGIGNGWFEKFYKDVYPSDEVIIREGIRTRPPKYYDDLFEQIDKKEFDNIKLERRAKAKINKKTIQQLQNSEKIQESKASFLTREI